MCNNFSYTLYYEIMDIKNSIEFSQKNFTKLREIFQNFKEIFKLKNYEFVTLKLFKNLLHYLYMEKSSN